MKEETCFIDCRSYGKQAETINQYVTRGRPILIEGRLQFQQWTAQDGNKRSKHVVIVEQFQFIDGRRSEEGAPRGKSTETREPAAEALPPPSEEDVPF